MARAVVTILGMALGALLVLAGGYDDSPGLQLIGVVVALGAGATGMRALIRSRRGTARPRER